MSSLLSGSPRTEPAPKRIIPARVCDGDRIVVDDKADDRDSWVRVEVAVQVARQLAVATRSARERRWTS